MLGPPVLAFATLAFEATRSASIFLQVLGVAYVLTLLWLLISQPWLHARRLATEGERARRQLAILRSEVRLPATQRERIGELRQLAGVLERRLNGRGLLQDQDTLEQEIEELGRLGGQLSQYAPISRAVDAFLDAAKLMMEWLFHGPPGPDEGGYGGGYGDEGGYGGGYGDESTGGYGGYGSYETPAAKRERMRADLVTGLQQIHTACDEVLLAHSLISPLPSSPASSTAAG